MFSVHVIAGLAPHYGGPSYSVPRLKNALTHAGCRTSLLTVQEPSSPIDPTIESFPRALSSLPIFSRFRFSPALRQALLVKAKAADVIHNHGLWLMPNVYAGHAARSSGKPLVASPRGMLAPAALQSSSIRKSLFWMLLQRPAFKGISAWHATSPEEADDIRCFGATAPVAIIPNGVDLPVRVAAHAPLVQRRTILFLSRVHPHKGLVQLIEAWSRIEADLPEWQVVIAGPDMDGYRVKLEAQIALLGVQRAYVHGATYGSDKEALLRHADLFVLPSKSENFGIAVAEALAAGVPAIVTKGAPWKGLVSEQCGWWIDFGIEPLVDALHAATAMPPYERQKMGLRGRAWMQRAYSWEAVAAQMIDLYSWTKSNGDRPDFIV